MTDKSMDPLIVNKTLDIEGFYITIINSSLIGGLEFVTADQADAIQNLLDFDKKEGVMDLRVIAMFPDEKEAVREALKKL